jgi:hypothetical protein
MPVWVALALIVVLVTLILRLAYVAGRRDLRHERTEALLVKQGELLIKQRDDARAQRDKLNTELSIATAAFTELDVMHQKTVAERDKWQGLYGELLNTLHDLQGDAHVTAPLQPAPVGEAAPMTYDEAKPSIDKAAQTSRRTTRKKAGA